jgi:hypothetical protein
MRTRIGLTIAALVLLCVGIGCFWLLSSATFSSITSDFDPVTGEPILSSSQEWRAFITTFAPVVGVASVAMAVVCGAGVVASLVIGDALSRSASLRHRGPHPAGDVELSAPETLEG